MVCDNMEIRFEDIFAVFEAFYWLKFKESPCAALLEAYFKGLVTEEILRKFGFKEEIIKILKEAKELRKLRDP